MAMMEAAGTLLTLRIRRAGGNHGVTARAHQRVAEPVLERVPEPVCERVAEPTRESATE